MNGYIKDDSQEGRTTCACGCGRFPKYKTSKYVAGHNLLGRTPWNKGKPMSDEQRKKLSQIQTERPLRYWLGKTRVLTEEWKKHMARNPWNKGKKFPQFSGVNHPAWKGTTPLKEAIRKCLEYKQWRAKIYLRDDFRCQKCGNGGKVVAHHLEKFSTIFEKYDFKNLDEACRCKELWNLSNGITLCKKCHLKVHSKGGHNGWLHSKTDSGKSGTSIT